MDQINIRTKNFYDNVQNYWGGYLCAICSPISKNFFKFYNASTVIRLNPEACMKQLVWFRYASYMSKIFNDVFFPVIQFIKCSLDKMEDVEYALDYIDGREYLEKREETRACFFDKEFLDKDCQKLCQINIDQFKIPMRFILNYKQALKSKRY